MVCVTSVEADSDANSKMSRITRGTTERDRYRRASDNSKTTEAQTSRLSKAVTTTRGQRIPVANFAS